MTNDTLRQVRRFMPGDMVKYQRGWSQHDYRCYLVIGWELNGSVVDIYEVLDEDLKDCRLVLFPFGLGKVLIFTCEEILRYVGIGHVA